MNKFLVAGLVVSIFATITCILSTSIPYWTYAHVERPGIEESLAAGLWKVCVSAKTTYSAQTECESFQATSWLKAVQALMVLGIIFLAISAATACLYLIKFYTNNNVFICMVFTAVLGGAVVIIGFVVYASKSDLEKIQAHYSGAFYLAIITAILSFVAASLFAVSKRSSGGYNTI